MSARESREQDSYDVAVIGGGLLGASFAWGLANRGQRTLMLDEGDDAIRTSRGNFGLVWVQGKGKNMAAYAGWTRLAARQWPQFAARLAAESGTDPRYHCPGGFELCLDDHELDASVQSLQALKKEAGELAPDFVVMDHGEVKKHIPQIGHIAGATYCPEDGHCDPLRLLRALHGAFRNRGGHYRPRTRVTTINPGGSGFEMGNGRDDVVARAGKVVIAAGHGSRALGEQVGLDIPVFPDQGQILVTEKTGPVLRYPTLDVRQTDDGSFLLGPSSRDAGYDTGTDPITLRDIARRCLRVLPLLGELRIQRTWAALRIMTPDGCPVYQQSDSHPGAFSFACHSGVTLAPNHALQVASWIEAGAIEGPGDEFHPRRFHVSTNTSAS